MSAFNTAAQYAGEYLFDEKSGRDSGEVIQSLVLAGTWTIGQLEAKLRDVEETAEYLGEVYTGLQKRERELLKVIGILCEGNIPKYVCLNCKEKHYDVEAVTAGICCLCNYGTAVKVQSD